MLRRVKDPACTNLLGTVASPEQKASITLAGISLPRLGSPWPSVGHMSTPKPIGEALGG